LKIGGLAEMKISNEITMIPTQELTPHPRNGEFFSRTEGDEYSKIRLSIEMDGILEPLLVTSNITIVADLGKSIHSLYRLEKLNNLIPPLQEKVSSQNLGLMAAVELSNLSEQEQYTALESLPGKTKKSTVTQMIKKEDLTIKKIQSIMKKIFQVNEVIQELRDLENSEEIQEKVFLTIAFLKEVIDNYETHGVEK
jgi:hypothetical protein